MALIPTQLTISFAQDHLAVLRQLAEALETANLIGYSRLTHDSTVRARIRERLGLTEET